MGGQCWSLNLDGGGGHQAAVDLLLFGVDDVLSCLPGPSHGAEVEVLWLKGLVQPGGVEAIIAVGELVILLILI